MRKHGHSFLKSGLIHRFCFGFGLLILLGIGKPDTLQAQCVLACNNKVQISVDTSCYLEVLPDMILEAPQRCPDADFHVVIMDKDTVVTSSPFLGPRYLWKTLKVKVVDRRNNNSCWGTIFVEDKQPPIIVCRDDTVHCNSPLLYEEPEVIEKCDTTYKLTLVGHTSETIDCDPDYIKLVCKYWVAEDVHGNKSPICKETFLLRRIPIDSVEAPKDFTKGNDCALACDSIFKLDENGHPHPDVTGTPLLDSVPLWPDFTHYCNISVDYKDTYLAKDSCKKKILRTWRIIEWWCGQALITSYPQVIEIIDEEGPVITCPRDWYITTDGGYKCQATIDLPPAHVYDVCAGDSVRVDVFYPGGFLKNSNGGRITLPAGSHLIEYRAFDPCYNMSVCTMYVHVADKTPPVTVCDKHTVVSLNQVGEVHVYADVLDDGTFDDCWLDSFAVKRMDEGAPCMAPDTLFMPYVRFCCADAGETRMVIFRAWDGAGNFNDCMVEVEVQDKLPPRIHCPDSVMVDCKIWIDTMDLSQFGKPHYTDNCGVAVEEIVRDMRNQCMLGVIYRVFIATDDGGRTDSCRQKIIVYDSDPFTGDSIIWPLDFDSNAGCLAGSLEPDNLRPPYDRPIAIDDECSLVGMSYEDEIFTFVPDSAACFKIIRTWKVIDWCTFDRFGNYAKYIHQQVIKVNNIVAPEIISGCEEKSNCTYDPDCLGGHIDLVAIASDDCTPADELVWHLQIDLDNNGWIDIDRRGRGDTIDASGEYPVGRHRIKYSFEDLCGNKGTCTTFFEIVNCKAPTAYCINGIATDLMPVDTNGDGTIDWGMIEIWANDFDLGSFHCNGPVTFSFSKDTTDKGRMYDCDSLGMRYVEMWVTDRVTGNQTFCRTHIIIQDNNDVCPDSMTVTAQVAGIIQDQEGEPLEEVKVYLEGMQNMNTMSMEDGRYAFSGVTGGNNYEVVPNRDEDPMKGVSTFDLLMIQRHLLGIEELPTPYHYLAADVDGNESVSVKDIIYLRRMILGLQKDFGSNPPWRFVQTTYQFPDPTNPWMEQIPEVFPIHNLAGDMMYVDFTGIKLGDLNGSYRNATGALQTRTPVVLESTLETDPMTGSHGITLRYNGEEQIAGLQFTVEYEPDRWYWNGHYSLSGSDPMAGGMAEVWPGVLSFSWMNLDPGQPFELHFELLGDKAAPSIRMTSQIARAEAYTLDGTEYPIQLRGGSMQTGIDMTTHPNPFAGEVAIRLRLAADQSYRLLLTDATGRAIRQWADRASASGEMQYMLRGGELPGHGIYYLVLQTEDDRMVKKLVHIPSR
jgi:hypothetical protein